MSNSKIPRGQRKLACFLDVDAIFDRSQAEEDDLQTCPRCSTINPGFRERCKECYCSLGWNEDVERGEV